jgi:uncharacterized protein YciI
MHCLLSFFPHNSFFNKVKGKNMFVILIHYKKPLDVVDQYLEEHRNYLEGGYKQDHFIASGPKNPRTGGVILSQLKDKKQLMHVIEKDPFFIHGVAEFEVIEFDAVKHHPQFSGFVK